VRRGSRDGGRRRQPCAAQLALLTALALAGCGGEAPAAPPAAPAAAKPAAAAHEADLGTLRLDAQAEQRLGIETQLLQAAQLPRQRLFGGDVLVPLWGPREAGGAARRADGAQPLLPPLTAVDLARVADQQLAADGAVESARIALETARTALARERGLLESGSGSGRAVDEAGARFETAAAALRNLDERRRLLGAPVFDAIAAGRRWVRVAVYAGDLDALDLDAEAAMAALGAAPADATQALRRVALPVSSGTATAATDLFYELEQPQPALLPGERVAVWLPLRGSAESLVVARSALVRDIHGGAWVYERTAPQTFVRRRVVVAGAQGDRVALASGPPAGAAIVTAGAAELFGAELGFAK
jgi:hypothetical protein